METDITSNGGTANFRSRPHHQSLNPAWERQNYDRQTENQRALGRNLPSCIRGGSFNSANSDETEQCGERNLWVREREHHWRMMVLTA